MKGFQLSTGRKCELVDITSRIEKCLEESGLSNGAVLVFVPHTTAGLTINENADPSVKSDILAGLETMVPESPRFKHAEGNSTAHIKASIMGSSLLVSVSGGRIELGTWQGIFFCEFDGPRNRNVWIRPLTV